MMVKLLAGLGSIALTLFFPIFLAPGMAEEEVKYGTYINTRFQFRVAYPKELLFPQPPPDNNDGRRFLSKSKDVELLVYGGYNALFLTLEEDVNRSLEGPEVRKITYRVLKSDWCVVSGFTKNKVFYLKRILMKDKKNPEDIGTFFTFYIEYPANKKKLWDKIVGKCSQSFKFDPSIKVGLEHIFE